MMSPLVDEFEEETFWEELTWRMADRDLLREHGSQELQAMPRRVYMDKLFAAQHKYAEELEKHGLDRIEIVRRKTKEPS